MDAGLAASNTGTHPRGGAVAALPPNYTSKPTHMGACVYIYSDVRIGQEGFGFASTTDGFLSVPQRGRVVLEDDVEVRANAKIDRGSRETRIGAGCRLDNLVQIGKCYSQPMLRHRRTGRRVQPYLKISSAGAGRRQWPGIFGSVKARRSADRRASFRMWFQARRCLAAPCSQKAILADKPQRSRR